MPELMGMGMDPRPLPAPFEEMPEVIRVERVAVVGEEEQRRAPVLATAGMVEVLVDGPLHGTTERHDAELPALPAPHGDEPLIAIEVVTAQRDRLPGAQPGREEQQDEREVPRPDHPSPVAGGEEPVHLGGRQGRLRGVIDFRLTDPPERVLADVLLPHQPLAECLEAADFRRHARLRQSPRPEMFDVDAQGIGIEVGEVAGPSFPCQPGRELSDGDGVILLRLGGAPLRPMMAQIPFETRRHVHADPFPDRAVAHLPRSDCGGCAGPSLAARMADFPCPPAGLRRGTPRQAPHRRALAGGLAEQGDGLQVPKLRGGVIP